VKLYAQQLPMLCHLALVWGRLTVFTSEKDSEGLTPQDTSAVAASAALARKAMGFEDGLRNDILFLLQTLVANLIQVLA
jgi:hypothetical protein